MASLPTMFARPNVRAQATTAKGATGGGKEEKGLIDFILGSLTKQDQFYETDPILQRAEDKSSGGTTSSVSRNKKNTVAVPQKKKKEGGGFGGLGGLFAKK